MTEEKINLLFADDESDFLTAMTKRLEARGFNVIAVERGEDALAAAKKQKVDIALLDLKMPGMGGEAALKQLKQDHEWMEIVILTGHGSVESAVEMTKSGAYTYLQKPCELETLLEVLKDAYKKKVMNKQQIMEDKMDDMLKLAMANSPLEILRQLKKMDSGA